MRALTAHLVAAAGIAVAFATAPVAVADPSDLLPVCSGDENPQLDNCSTGCAESAPRNADGTCSEPGTVNQLPSTSTGADPNVPVGPQGG